MPYTPASVTPVGAAVNSLQFDGTEACAVAIITMLASAGKDPVRLEYDGAAWYLVVNADRCPINSWVIATTPATVLSNSDYTSQYEAAV